MMIKLLIADDESFIRQGISRTIPWEETDIEIVGEAANGQEALEMCIQLKPEIVLADIQMPIKNGLELARQLNELMPRIKVIILTAYDSTENLKNAIDVKVSSFITKNADSGRILQAVLKAKRELIAESEIDRENVRVHSIFQENQQLIKFSLLRQYFAGDYTAEAFEKKARKIGLEIEDAPFSILVIQCIPDDVWQTLNHFYYIFRVYHPIIFWVEEDILAVIIHTDAKGIPMEKMEEYLPEMMPYVFSNRIVLMNHINHYALFPQAYLRLYRALDSCFWNVEEKYLAVESNAELTPPAFTDLLNLESAVVTRLLSRRLEDIKIAFDDYYQTMKAHVVPRKTFLQSVDRLIVSINAVLGKPSDSAKLSEVIKELETPDEIIDLLLSLLKTPEPGEYKNDQIRTALKYIDENYASDIKLADVAKAAYFSTGYLSRIFKSETEYTFKEWLNKVRIEKAQELIIHTNLKYYEIAEKVGYKDYKYFSSYFNKLCGCSAKEYKQNHNRQYKQT